MNTTHLIGEEYGTAIKSAWESAKHVQCAIAWARIGDDKMIRKIQSSIIGLNLGQTRKKAFEMLRKKDNLFVRLQGGIFHPKLFVFTPKNSGNRTAILGSANLSDSALSSEYEIGISTDDPDIVKTAIAQIEAWRENFGEKTHAYEEAATDWGPRTKNRKENRATQEKISKSFSIVKKVIENHEQLSRTEARETLRHTMIARFDPRFTSLIPKMKIIGLMPMTPRSFAAAFADSVDSYFSIVSDIYKTTKSCDWDIDRITQEVTPSDQLKGEMHGMMDFGQAEQATRQNILPINATHHIDGDYLNLRSMAMNKSIIETEKLALTELSRLIENHNKKIESATSSMKSTASTIEATVKSVVSEIRSAKKQSQGVQKIYGQISQELQDGRSAISKARDSIQPSMEELQKVANNATDVITKAGNDIVNRINQNTFLTDIRLSLINLSSDLRKRSPDLDTVEESTTTTAESLSESSSAQADADLITTNRKTPMITSPEKWQMVKQHDNLGSIILLQPNKEFLIFAERDGYEISDINSPHSEKTRIIIYAGRRTEISKDLLRRPWTLIVMQKGELPTDGDGDGVSWKSISEDKDIWAIK